MHIIPEAGPSLALTLPFLVTFFGLWVILWKPLAAYLDAREQATAGARTEAARITQDADAKATELEARLVAARAEVNELLAGARTRALAEEARIVAAARAASEARLAEAQAQLAQDAARARAELKAQASALSGQIVDTLLPQEA